MEELKPLPLWQYGMLVFALGMAAGLLVAMAAWGIKPGAKPDKPPVVGQYETMGETPAVSGMILPDIEVDLS